MVDYLVHKNEWWKILSLTMACNTPLNQEGRVRSAAQYTPTSHPSGHTRTTR